MIGAIVQEGIKPEEKDKKSIDTVVDSDAFPPDIKCFKDLRPYVLKCFEALADKNNYERKGDYLYAKTEEIITRMFTGMGFDIATVKLFVPDFHWIMRKNDILKNYWFRKIPSEQHSIISPKIVITDAFIIEYGFKRNAKEDSLIIYEPGLQKADALDLTNKFMRYIYSEISYLRMIKEIR